MNFLFQRWDTTEWKYLYKYDDKGNKIEQKQYDEKGTLLSIITSSYTYYANEGISK